MSYIIKNNYPPNIWYFAIAGLCSLLIGIGLCRFAYTPLIPALINEGWLTQAGASYLGTINFVGYLLGAFLAQRASKYFEIPFLIKVNLVISIIGLALCSINFGFIWLAIWRFAVGVSGAILMVLTPAIILKKIPLQYRGRAAGIMFTGMGIGVVLSGFFFPFLSKISIPVAWLGAAFLAFIATLIAWPAFSKIHHSTKPSITSPIAVNVTEHHYILMLLAITYALFAVGTIPHTLFLVDYVHRELTLDLVMSGMFWSIFGVGSLIGPYISGIIADKVGIYKSLVGSFLICCIAITMVLFNHMTILYVLSSFLMGLLLPAIVALISSRIIELVGADLHPKYWGKMTLYYALAQALGAYVMSYLLHNGFTYTGCFIIAGLAFLLGLIIVSFTKTSESSQAAESI